MNFAEFKNNDICKYLHFAKRKISNSEVLQIKYSGMDRYTHEFSTTFNFSDIATSCNKSLELRVYFNLIPLIRTKSDDNFIPNNKYPYVDFYINFYTSQRLFLGKIRLVPNVNILLTMETILRNLASNNLSDVSFITVSMDLHRTCKFCLGEMSFSFVDFISTHVIHDEKSDHDMRLMVNNIKKKKKGVIIFFPSFYIQERDAGSILREDSSIKWPNFTRFTWSKDLDGFCTVFVSDPLQYVDQNEKSSWFIDHKGNSLLPAIAYKIKDMLGLNDGTCGPIINYGSSMGGYAAFLFSCYLKPDLCFAECPQANLTKYKYSLEYLKQYPELDYQKDIYNCLSFSKIIKEHKPEFKSLFHFYALDKLHLDNFNSEISKLSEDEIKKFNYSLVVENDAENDLHGHQAMPKEKVLEIFHRYLK